VMAMTRSGFWSAFDLAGPSNSGWRIFWSSDVPRGVRPANERYADQRAGPDHFQNTDHDVEIDMTHR
jgi:hypothetical protein